MRKCSISGIDFKNIGKWKRINDAYQTFYCNVSIKIYKLHDVIGISFILNNKFVHARVGFHAKYLYVIFDFPRATRYTSLIIENESKYQNFCFYKSNEFLDLEKQDQLEVVELTDRIAKLWERYQIVFCNFNERKEILNCGL